MRKTKEIAHQKPTIEQEVMAKVHSGEIMMKPKWYFILGSLLTFLGMSTLTIVAIFFTNITLFLARKHGPMGQWRLQQFVADFPLWIPIVAIVGTIAGIWMLKKYDFSYKKNFWLVTIFFIGAILFSGYIIDSLGLNDALSRRGPTQRFYRRLERREINRPKNVPKPRRLR